MKVLDRVMARAAKQSIALGRSLNEGEWRKLLDEEFRNVFDAGVIKMTALLREKLMANALEYDAKTLDYVYESLRSAFAEVKLDNDEPINPVVELGSRIMREHSNNARLAELETRVMREHSNNARLAELETRVTSLVKELSAVGVKQNELEHRIDDLEFAGGETASKFRKLSDWQREVMADKVTRELPTNQTGSIALNALKKMAQVQEALEARVSHLELTHHTHG